MNDSTEVRSEEAIKGWGRCGTKAKVVDGRYKLCSCSSGFLATLQEEEIIKREVETTKKHIGRILNLSRQCQKRQIGRKNFPNKSLNVRSQNFFKLLMEMFFHLVDG